MWGRTAVSLWFVTRPLAHDIKSLIQVFGRVKIATAVGPHSYTHMQRSHRDTGRTWKRTETPAGGFKLGGFLLTTAPLCHQRHQLKTYYYLVHSNFNISIISV